MQEIVRIENKILKDRKRKEQIIGTTLNKVSNLTQNFFS